MSSKHWLMVAIGALAAYASPAHSKKANPTIADLGPPPTAILESVKSAAQTYLKDPASAYYQIGNVFPAYCKNGWLSGGGVAWQGWAVNVLINARNSYGGYTGYQAHTVLFVGDNAIRIMEGENFGVYGPPTGLLGLEGGAGVCKLIKQ